MIERVLGALLYAVSRFRHGPEREALGALGHEIRRAGSPPSDALARVR
ncbi:MAG: hypothetical protein WCA77_01360 [Thermoplasmata archaeon]